MNNTTQTIAYKAGIRETNDILVNGSTFWQKVKNLKKLAGIDCRSIHRKQVIFSEFRDECYGVFFWNKKTGDLDAWIDFK